MTEQEDKQRANFTANACRAGLFASAVDIMEQMIEAKTPKAAAALMIGATMFAAEIVHNTIHSAGGDIPRAREWLLTCVGDYFDQYSEQAVREAASKIIASDPAVQ
jgi:hypothetical protein